jgi:Type IV secretory pathway, VirJ component
MSRRLRGVWLFSLVILLVLLSACGSDAGNAEEATPAPTASAEPEAAPTAEPTPELAFTAPLTGLKRETAAAARPIAVMINNLKPARPQSGLTNADVVWEVLAEGGITRLVAIFQSTDALTDAIGPIRSIRPYLIDIGESYGAILAHSGASNDGYDILQHQGKPYLDEISNAGPYFWRSKDRKAPHNLYSELEKLRAGAEKKGYKSDVTVPGYPFSEQGSTASGEAAASIEIKFLLKDYKVSYAYDEASGLYKRSINDEPHTDMNNGEQLTAANVVVLGANHKTLDDYGRLAVDLHAGGSAILFQKGKAVSCEWVRSDDNMIRLMKDGAELAFVPGKTFFQIVPNTPTFSEHVVYG